MSFPRLGGGSGGGLGGGGLPIGRGGGIGLVIVLIVLAVCVAPRLGGDGGGDLGDILGGDPFSGFGQAQPGDTTTPLDPDDKLFGFVNAVVDDVNPTWIDIFAESGQRYLSGELYGEKLEVEEPERDHTLDPDTVAAIEAHRDHLEFIA